MKSTLYNPAPRRSVGRRTAVALAIALGFGTAGAVYAQSTTGSIFGQAPVAAGETVRLVSSTGIQRETPVDSRGRYTFSSLPLGSYTVALVRDGATVDTRQNIAVTVNAGTQVTFTGAQGTTELGAVTVNASALPPIDVSAVDSRTVITQKQMQQLPLGRSAEAVALLAPGVAAGAAGTGFASPTGGGLVSFGGSGISENAYYINGMNTTDPIDGYGGITLPYGAVDQQETLTGGYSAKYGRSDGGVINIVGRSGTNEWHGGAQILYQPKWASEDPDNYYYAPGSTSQGELYRYRQANKSWSATYSAYMGGPLIKDRLFGFLAVEGERTSGYNVAAVAAGQAETTTFQDPKWYAKLDWNIDDNNLIEFTGAGDKDISQGNVYNFDNSTFTQGDFINSATYSKTSQEMGIAKYTGHLTDNLTLTAQYGRQKTQFYTAPGASDPNLIYILDPNLQNPAYTGGAAGGIQNAQSNATVGDPRKESKGTNYRVDLAYTLGSHTISAGIDNQSTQDNYDGTSVYGNAGYLWDYGTAPATGQFVGGLVTPPANGYYASQYRYSTAGSVRIKQRAQYLEDSWQVNDRLLLNIGIRNDRFVNFNGSGQPFIKEISPQWAPRLGASWDVFGDSSLKIYGNAGRYYLALPAEVALRAASGSLYTNTYYSYTGIDPATGYPTGIQALPTVNGPGAPISANNEYGQSPDPNAVKAQGIAAEYQDEFILGFDKTLGSSWVYGSKLTYRNLRNAIDDYCDTGRIEDKAASLGFDTSKEDWSSIGCYLMNPGRANTFKVANDAGGYDSIKMSNDDLGLPPLKRQYYSADFYLEHVKGDGNWWGRVDYTFSRSYGNNEGQVDSAAGTRSSPGATESWDFAQLMEYSNGLLPNNHTHALKAYGAYQITPEFMVSGDLLVQSGMPRECYGGYGADQSQPITGYGNEAYHYCNGLPSPPGQAGSTPWLHILSLNAEYRPAFADHKLAFNVMVYNVTNQQVATQESPYYGVSQTQPLVTPDPEYNLPLAFTNPRYVRFGVTYDF